MDRNVLSQPKTAHALRHFTLAGALWAIYGPNATAAGAIFSGFALHIGLSESQIAFLVSLSALAGTSQLVSFYLTRRVVRKQRFMVILGHFEITAASCVVLMALVPPQYRFAAVSILLVSAYLIGHTNSPIFNSWLSNVVPEDVRATYIGRRMFIITITSMVYLYGASVWIDRAPGLTGFLTVFTVGWIGGLLGYWLLIVTPMPRMEVQQIGGFASSLLEPFKERPFVLLALFLCAWTVAMQIAGAFYGIYMIKYLELSYSRIAIYTNITLLCMVVGYLGTGPLAQRYGSKPLTQILIIPALAGPVLWMLTTRENCSWVIPICSVINGIAISGLSVALSSLLYKLVPKGVENSQYFANWTGLQAMAAAAGPFLGGLLRDWLPEQVVIGGLELTSIQVIFGISGATFLLPLILSAFIIEPDASSPGYLMGQFRGNLLSFAYNFALYRVARENEKRARAIRDLGRSRTPLAVSPLVRALGHMSKEVRSEAARGLGDGHFPEAIPTLVEALEDEESDIRPEAAEALGKIGDRSASGPLLRALQDGDPRVRASAALALGAINDDEAAETLLAALQEPYDHAIFPTLVEAATRRPDLRLVEPIMDGLQRLRQPVVRMQVLNGVCRVLGEKNHFYRLANAEALQRAAMSDPMMQRILRLIGSAYPRTSELGSRLRAQLCEASRALEDDEVGGFATNVRLNVEEMVADGTLPLVARTAATAILRYLDEGRVDMLRGEGVVLLIIALTALARSVAGKHPQDPHEEQ